MHEKRSSAYVSRLKDAFTDVAISEREKIYHRYDEGISRLVELFIEQRDKGNCIVFIGNGGSAAIAMHMTADFMKNGGMKTMSMFDPSIGTCLSNDYGYDNIFSKQIGRLMGKGDILVAISSSGNSANIVNGIEEAKEIGAKTIAFTGFTENNKARLLADINVYVPSMEYGIVESLHVAILQQVVDLILEQDELDV